ncbi:MAG: DUF4349 domain-containing protein, partial [Myxococcota bacterium]
MRRALIPLALLFGCSSGGVSGSAPAEMIMPEPEPVMAPKQAPADNESALQALGYADTERAEAGFGSGASTSRTMSEQPAEPPAPAKKRLVYYNGFMELRVTEPQQTLEQAVKKTEEAGGYVETFSDNRVVLRVPVALFRDIFDDLLALGEIVSRSVNAQDITDAYTSMELRLKTLRASRDRLIELLARARTEE